MDADAYAPPLHSLSPCPARDLPQKFTRQKPLGHSIADFYCSSSRLVIEVDGDSHFDDRGEAYDARRTKVLGAEGIRVLRVTNLEVMEEFEGVCQRIRDALTRVT
jgi:very-short-patch-repair endonuclease